MNEEITANLNYEWAKTEITKELQTEANSFIRVGWIFKMVRDGKIETPYGSVIEFAEKEWNLGKDVVSRYMRINDHFSINGYSEKIAPQYGSFGYSKLAIMLTLPDEINAELSTNYSKSDIQTIKDEYDAEKKITPLEVMAEPKADQPETEGDEFLALIVRQINDEHPDPINSFHFESRSTAEALGIPEMLDAPDTAKADIQESYMPDGDESAYNIRISGQSRFLVSMKDSGITVTNMRTLEKSSFDWNEFTAAVLEDEKTRTFTKPLSPQEKKAKREKVHQSEIQKKARKVQERYEKAKAEENQPENDENGTKNDKNAQNPTENVQKLTEEIEKVKGEVVDNEGQRIDNAPQNIPYPDGEEPEITHVLSEDPLPKETDTAAGENTEIVNNIAETTDKDSKETENKDSAEAAGEDLDKDQQRCIVQLDYIKFAVLDHEWTEAAEHLIELRKIIDDKIDGLIDRD